jgi:hypothetical protein
MDNANPPEAWPSPDAPGVVALRPKFLFVDMLRSLVPWIIVLFFVWFFSLLPGVVLAGAVLPEYDPNSAAPPLQFPLAFLTSLLITGLVIWLILTLRRRVYTRSVLLCSPTGIEVQDHLGARIRMRWGHVAGIEPMSRLVGSPVGGLLYEPAVPTLQQPGAAGRQAHPADSIVGWGQLIVPTPEPKQWQVRLEQSTVVDPKTGLYEVGFRFASFGPVHSANPLVAQVLRYRPDLFGGPAASSRP